MGRRVIGALGGVVFLCASARAQPAEPPPPPPPSPTAAPGATPADDYQACLAERRRRSRYAQTITDVNERARILQEMPECKDPNAVVIPLVPPPPPRTGGTAEVQIGLGRISFFGESRTGLGGLNLGFGGFLTPQLALTGRLAGAFVREDDVSVYVGFLGPSLQGWVNDHFWLGGGFGIGLVGACGDECDGETSSGFDLRAGVNVSPPDHHNSTSISIEYTTYDASMGMDVSTLSFLLGYQSL